MALPTQSSLFSAEIVPLAAQDANIRLKAILREDTDARKVDLSLRSYRDENGEQPVLPVVEKAEKLSRNTGHRISHDYLPVAGLLEFNRGAAKLVLGKNNPAIQEERVASFQTVSGTGAIHLGALFLSKFLLHRNETSSPQPVMYVSDPTWGNHHKIFSNVGFSTGKYPYWAAATKNLDLDGMLRHFDTIPSGSIIVLQASGHNPTGVDPSEEQWAKIADVLQRRRHVTFFDFTYQGMVSGDFDQDAWPVRHFVERGIEVCVAQSFAKNCGLYGQRVGCLHVVTADKDAARRITSQLTLLQRCTISSPPLYGARLASLILNDDALMAEWKANVGVMRDRMVTMRKALRSKLETMDDTAPSWINIITDQVGMYCFLGLSEAQSERLRNEFHIYTTKNGRITVAGLKPENLDYVAKGLLQVMSTDDHVA